MSDVKEGIAKAMLEAFAGRGYGHIRHRCAQDDDCYLMSGEVLNGLDDFMPGRGLSQDWSGKWERLFASVAGSDIEVSCRESLENGEITFNDMEGRVGAGSGFCTAQFRRADGLLILREFMVKDAGGDWWFVPPLEKGGVGA